MLEIALTTINKNTTFIYFTDKILLLRIHRLCHKDSIDNCIDNPARNKGNTIYLIVCSNIQDFPRLDCTTLGHIHKAQNLNEGNHPPVIYSGSIERVDFGEVKDDKFFVMADVEKGKTEMDWRKLEEIRPFHDRYLKLASQKDITEQVISALPASDVMEDAVVHLVLEYPRAWAPLIDDGAIQDYASGVFEFHFVKRPQMDERIRLPNDQTAGDLMPAELLEKFW